MESYLGGRFSGEGGMRKPRIRPNPSLLLEWLEDREHPGKDRAQSLTQQVLLSACPLGPSSFTPTPAQAWAPPPLPCLTAWGLRSLLAWTLHQPLGGELLLPPQPLQPLPLKLQVLPSISSSEAGGDPGGLESSQGRAGSGAAAGRGGTSRELPRSPVSPSLRESRVLLEETGPAPRPPFLVGSETNFAPAG